MDPLIDPAAAVQFDCPDFRRLFESAPNLYLVMTPGWIIVAASDAYLRTTMTDRESIVGRHALDVFPENPADAATNGARLILESFQTVVDTGKTDVLPFQKYDIRSPNGVYEEHYWTIVNSPLIGSNGKVELVIHRVEDVTEVVRSRQSMEEQEKRSAALAHKANLLALDVAMRTSELRNANRELHQANAELSTIRANLERRIDHRTADLQRRNQVLEEIAYAASHDLQEPLRAVAGYCQLLLMEYVHALKPEAVDYLQKAAAGAHRMSAMIKGILQFARIPKNAQSLQPTDANAAFIEALSSLESAISESHATVQRGDLPTVVSDHVLLTQLFQNLIGNSIKYRGHRPPVVLVKAHASELEWTFSVSDNGIGIPVESRERIFAIFQRLNSRNEIQGTGIGLALCRQIVERHGGRIWIEGESSEGTTVCFTIPIRNEAA